MLAVKENKVYSVQTDEEKAAYIARGFDITDDSGNILEYGKGKTVPYGKYKRLEEENEKLKAKLAKQK